MVRRIVVTGSASGIGDAVARRFRLDGAEIIGVDRADAEVTADLSTDDGRLRAADEVSERAGGVVDAVVACAGLSGPIPATVSVNYFGVTRFLERLRPALEAAARPRVAIVGSISGTQPQDSDVVAACLADDEQTALARAATVVEGGGGAMLYPSSKSALAQWIRRSAVCERWAGAGIPLNAIAPGVVRTPMSESLMASEQMKKVMDEAVPMLLNGYADAEVIAEALYWLASPANSHMTGQVIYVDGGAEATLRGADVF